MSGPVRVAAVASPRPGAGPRRIAYRILVAITVFVPILATFFAIWRLWGEGSGD